MDPILISNILLWIHLLALVGGGVTSIVMPIVGSMIPTAPPESRPILFAVASRVVSIGRGALGVLLVTGPLMFWLKWQFTAVSMTWFSIKMALVAVMLIGVIVGGINFRKAQQGDLAAARTARLAGSINGVALLGIVLAAVFAFN